ncbi:MAG: HDOD domain-containing protein [Spirochaetes bacterium]|nr:HDOD domain-containing protein [Spirochaetota bacterium]
MFNSSELAKQFDRGEEVAISFQYVNKEIEIDVNSLLSKVLSRLDKGYLYDTLVSVFRELIQNGIKANMKRVWFEAGNLDINDMGDYRKGMEKFREVAYHPEVMRDQLRDSRYRVTLKMRNREGGLDVSVVNNARVLPGELERIRYRMRKALEWNNFVEAYENMYDATEGAGLGIILSVMLLKNAGLDAEVFNVIPDEGSMTISLRIPPELKSIEITSSIKSQILEDVNSLPTFPENVLELRQLCDNPETTIDTISEKISLDPALAADVLKLSNSAGFISGKRITKISQAVMIIGLKNLNSMLTAAALRKIMDKRYRKFEQIWEHCNRTAYYARQIAMEVGYGKVVDIAYIAGLLHDIGKIVLLSTDARLLNQISDIVNDRKIRTSSIIEEISIGISHSAIGALIADKWNFPEELVEAVRYHHAPLAPNIRHREVVMVVYLANQLCILESKEMDPLFIESEVLDKLSITSRTAFEKFVTRLQNRYDMHEQFLLKYMP